MKIGKFLAICAAGWLASVSVAKESLIVGNDYHSFANPDEIRVNHLDLFLDVDFERRVLSGSVILKIEFVDKNARTLILDT
ncbi:MAG: hypothetical protein MJA83_02655, partial [Gammaproteobacteria bacterium]|nr:hypothetical protein [Gammaproteobacteria bacterium]